MDAVNDTSLTLAQARSVDVGTILSLYDGELIGFKEARTLLEDVLDVFHFREARDSDLDNEIVRSQEDARE